MTFGVDRKDLRDHRIGVFAADDHMTTGDGHESRPGIVEERPESPVVGHVHEVHSQVVVAHRGASLHRPTPGVHARG